MQDSSSTRRCDIRKKTRERSLKRRKPKSSLVSNGNTDPLDLENPESQLTRTNIKNIITDQIFRSFPQECQSKLVELLPPCDRVTGLNSSVSLGPEALNNEFFAKACLEWRERLSDGDFTQDTQMRCKIEREKRLHVDEWKKKYFESFWGEKLIKTTSTTATATAKMALSSPVVGTSMHRSAQEKHNQLTDSLVKLKHTLHSPSVARKSSQQVKEQLSQMLNNKSLQLPKSNGAGKTVASSVAAARKPSLPDTIDIKLEYPAVEKLLENTSTGRSVANGSVRSSGSQPVKKEPRTTCGSVLLGKRAMEVEQGVDSCLCKRASTASLDRSKSQNDTKPGSATSLMPILANALLTNYSNSAASYSSSIPNVAVLVKPLPAGDMMSTLQSRVVSLSNLVQSESRNISAGAQTSSNLPTLSGDALIQNKELFRKFTEPSSVSNAKQSSSASEGIGFQRLEPVASLHGNDKQSIGISGNQLNPLSKLLPSSGIPLLSSLLVSSAPLFCSAASNPTSSIQSLCVGSEKIIPTGTLNAFKRVALNTEAATRESNDTNPVISSQEPLFIVQQVNPSPNVKPLAQPIALPNQTPVIVVLGNPFSPGVRFSNSPVPHVSVAAGMPKLAINNRLSEFLFPNRCDSLTPGVAGQTQQTVVPSGRLLVAGKPVGHPNLKAMTFACQATSKVNISSLQIGKPITTIAQTAASFATSTTSSCSIVSNTNSTMNVPLQKFACVNLASVAQSVKLNWPGLANPLVIANQRPDRLVSSGNLSTQTSSATSFGIQPQGTLVGQLKHCTSICPSLLTSCHPPIPTVVAEHQLPQMLVTISEASSQISGAAKNSSGNLPLHVLQSKSVKSHGAVKFGSEPLMMLGQTTPSSVRMSCVSGVPSVTCCSILPSAINSASACTPVPLFLIQSPSVKAGPSSSETAFNLSTQLKVSSMSTSNCASSLIKLPSQTPLVFQVVPDGVQSIEPQNIVLNMMPGNGSVMAKIKHDNGESQNKVRHPVCFSASCSVNSNIGTSEAKPVDSIAHTLNGGKMKLITIKIPQSSSCHLVSSSNQQIPVPARSLIKTLLSVHEPQMASTIGHRNGLTSALCVNKTVSSHVNSSSSSHVNANVAALKEGDTHKVCVRCGSSFSQSKTGRGAIASDLSDICVECQSPV